MSAPQMKCVTCSQDSFDGRLSWVPPGEWRCAAHAVGAEKWPDGHKAFDGAFDWEQEAHVTAHALARAESCWAMRGGPPEVVGAPCGGCIACLRHEVATLRSAQTAQTQEQQQ